MPIQPSATRVPDQISDLAADLVTVEVSPQPKQNTPLVFGDFSDVAMPIGEMSL